MPELPKIPSMPPLVIKNEGGGGLLKNLVTVGGIAIAGYGIWELRKYLKKQQEKADLKRDQDSTVKPKPGGKLFDITGRPITSANLATIAIDLNDALNFPVDQGRVVRVFQSTPFGSVPELEKLFMEKGFGNLRERMVKKLSDPNWIKVKFNFR